MALFMTQFTYSTEAWNALSKKPVDRTEAIQGLAQKLGGKVLNFYSCFGEYDGVVIYEVPDDKAAAALAVAAGLPGHLKMVKTTKLFAPQETMEILRKVGSLSYQAPSAT